jgi:hypothetical protein
VCFFSVRVNGTCQKRLERERSDLLLRKSISIGINQDSRIHSLFPSSGQAVFIRHNGRFDFLYDAFKEAAGKKYDSITINGMTMNPAGWNDYLAKSLNHSRPGECAWHAKDI